jgi:hypothetical protein
MSPLKLIECFAWTFFSGFVKRMMIILAIILPFTSALKCADVNIITYMTNLIFLISIMYFCSALVVFALYYVTKNNLHRVLLVFTGLFEMLGFMVLVSYTDNIPIKYIDYILKKVNLLMLHYTSSSKLVPITFTILIEIFLFSLSYFIFKQVYFKNGSFLINDINRTTLSNSSKFVFFRKKFFVVKDIKLLSRDFSRLKFIIVTVIIFFISILKADKTLSINSTIVMMFIYVFILSIQLVFDNMSIEQRKVDLFILSNLSMNELFKQKYMSVFIKLSFLSVIYYLFLIFKIQSIEFIELITSIVLFFGFCIMLTKICSYFAVRISILLWKGNIEIKDFKYFAKECFVFLCLLFLYIIVVAILYLIEYNMFVKIFCLAFNTFSSSVLLNKLAEITMNTNIYEWREHLGRTKT